MGSITFALPDPEEEKLRAKAQSMGISVSAYLRTLLLDTSRRHPDAPLTDLSRQIRALVPTFAEALCRTLDKTPEQMARLTKLILERYEKER